MKCSVMGFYVVTAVNGGIKGIFIGKAWVKAMRVCQSVAAAPLQRFLSIKQNTFDVIEQYSKQLIYIQLVHIRLTISSWPALLIH